MFLLLFQGFSQLELTPMQAVAVLQRCEHRMGQKIPQADLDAGRIGQYLQPEDYKPLQDVSSTVLTIRYCNPRLGARRVYAVNMRRMCGHTPGVRPCSSL